MFASFASRLISFVIMSCQVMVDPDPVQRPSAKELVENPIFDKIRKHRKTYMKP